jgi:DNA replication ATP-dependent helicase Dna2
MYRSLFQFVQFDERKKRLLFTLEAPQKPEQESFLIKKGLTEEQGNILQKMINAKDYFLLWGPPGTGKTSVMLRHFVAHLLNETDENILLLAYTNRAVDEICDAIEIIDPLIKNEYIRIGSRFSTQERFHDQLLDQKISKIDSRKDLKDTIQNHRIYVATIASLASKMDLLKLKKFHRVIIDEASQILEPMLVGLLPHFEHFILIGDHKQLPAVVVQSPEESKIESPKLKEIGLENMRDSLFERLFKRCIEKEWHWAFARLSHQGRMHHDIMDFPNEHFYNSGLKILPEQLTASKFQTQNIDLQKPANISYLEQILFSRRNIFLSTEIDNNSRTGKTNAFEANLICELVYGFKRIYEFNNRAIDKNSIGIITPYRAQIAQIRQALMEKGIDPELLTIDTVERYQGGARDVILISLCLNNQTQLSSLVSLSEDGVDRKLNVALTRARQHLVVLGNVEILQQNAIYKNLMESFEAKVRVNN